MPFFGAGDPAVEAAPDDHDGENVDDTEIDDEIVDSQDRSGKPLRIAIIGRPNAGKSTLINRIIGDERLLTGPEAGITRDSISIDWTWRDRPLKLFDRGMSELGSH